MADPQSPVRPIVTPRQLLLIGVLGVILAAVLIAEFGGASGAPEGASPGQPGPPASASGASAADARPGPAASPTAPAPAAAAAPAPSAAENAAPRAWPKLDGEAAAGYDPFAMPAPLALRLAADQEGKRVAKPARATQRKAEEALASLRSKGTMAVLRNERGAVAVIGNRVVRVGDVIEGYRVVSIDAGGVLLAPSGREEMREERK
jgi:hypothetical protein